MICTILATKVQIKSENNSVLLKNHIIIRKRKPFLTDWQGRMTVSEEPSRTCYQSRDSFHDLIAGDDGDEAQSKAGKGVEDGGEG